MWFSRLFWKLFFIYAGLNLTLVVCFLLVAINGQRDLVLQQARLRLRDSAVLLRSQLPQPLEAQSADELRSLLEQLSALTDSELSLHDARGKPLAALASDAPQQPPVSTVAASQGLNYHSVIETDRDGRSRLVLTLPVPEQGPPQGYIRAALDLEPIEAPLVWTEQLLMALTFGGGLIALGATYFMVGRIVHPLARLTEGAQAIAAGDDQHPVYVESSDELGMLGGAFNHMQRELSSRLGQLRENSERLATVLGSMVEGVIAVDTDRTILLANEAGRTLLDFVTSDAVGRPLLEVTRSRPVLEAVEQAFDSDQPVQQEFESPGVPRRVLMLRATRLPGDPCPGVVLVLHDMTELRRLENLRRELVANVSHELKTPLASIKAYAETLRLGAIHDPDINLTFIGRIEEQAERLHQLIIDLLQIARLESGQATFDIGEVPVAEVVEKCVGQHAGAAGQKKLELVVDPPEEPLSVLADDEGVLTILNNLVDNAIKYTPEGGRITVRWRAGEGGVVNLEVQDTGIGIAPHDQMRVFERFYRVDKARSRELGGTGLGLSIVKHMAQAFNGQVGLQSKLKQGTTFRVSLPRF